MKPEKIELLQVEDYYFHELSGFMDSYNKYRSKMTEKEIKSDASYQFDDDFKHYKELNARSIKQYCKRYGCKVLSGYYVVVGQNEEGEKLIDFFFDEENEYSFNYNHHHYTGRNMTIKLLADRHFESFMR
jgi:hypothetical protein